MVPSINLLQVSKGLCSLDDLSIIRDSSLSLSFLQHTSQALRRELVTHQCAIPFHLGVRLVTGPVQFACHQAAYLRPTTHPAASILHDASLPSAQSLPYLHPH